MEYLSMIWQAVNSPVGITFLAGVFLWLLNKLYGARPAWLQYEGTIIAAIKYAEKQIPNDVSNKSLAKLDTALNYVLRIYQELNGKRATTQVEAELREGIQVKHAELEATGVLTK